MEQFINAAKTFLTDVVFKNIPQIIVALLILWIGLKLIKLLSKFMRKTYEKHKVEPSLQIFLSSLVEITLKILLFLTVMGIIGIKMTSFIAILSAAGLAVGMALQGTLQNFAGGVIILLLKPFKVGDYIEQGSYAGTVASIRIFSTTLSTVDNLQVIVPNTELATKSLTNFSTMEKRRVVVKVGIAYGESVDRARETLIAVAKDCPNVLQDPTPGVSVTDLGESSVNLAVVVWTIPQNYWNVFFTMNERVYNALNEANISIPFNQLDVHIAKEN